MVQVPPPQPYCEAKKDIMASNPRNLTISGVFLAFSRFFAIMRFADTECRKNISFQKNGSLQDVEQLSPAAKAHYPFLRAESAMILRTFSLFSFNKIGEVGNQLTRKINLSIY